MAEVCDTDANEPLRIARASIHSRDGNGSRACREIQSCRSEAGERGTEAFWLILAGAIVGTLGRLLGRTTDPLLWPATVVVGVAAMLLIGLLLGDGFLTYAFATVVAGLLVVSVARVWPERV